MAHLLDLNAQEQIFDLPYIQWIKRCEDTERRLRFLNGQCKLHNIDLVKAKTLDSLQNLSNFVAADRKIVSILIVSLYMVKKLRLI